MKLDLSDAELDELDALLAGTPAPLQPLDVVMLDGYLCGVLVQPQWIAPQQWLPHVFDMRGTPLPDDVDPGWRDRTEQLALRHAQALNRALAEDGIFEPVLPETPAEPSDPAVRDALREMPAHAGVLLPWVAGFQHACLRFPALLDSEDEALMQAGMRVFRHLPGATEDERRVLAQLESEHPLHTLEEAIDDLVMAVSELWELTQDQRFHVETVRRALPKVGRNDPCPCGSGRKYKLCHGAG